MDEKKKSTTDAVPRGQTLEQLAAELARVRKKASHFDAHAMWSDKELQAQQRNLGFVRRKIRNLAVAAAVLAMLLIGGTTYTYYEIEASHALLAALPDSSGLNAVVDEQADAFARQLADLSDQLDSLSADGEIIEGFGDRIAALESGTATTLESLASEVAQAARIEAEARLDTARRLDALNPRIEAAEMIGEETSFELSELEEDVARMRSGVAEELALLTFGTGEILQSVDRRIAGNERGLEAVSWEVGRERMDFELFEDYRLEVAPGVILNVSDTDVAYQKVNGWLHLVDDGRILRLEDQPIQESLVFYGTDDERSYELVFTGVRPDVAIGYLRVPDDDGVRIVNHVRDPAFGEQASAIR